MAENTDENTMWAVRTLKRGSDGMLYIRYVDENTGDIISDSDLENYQIRGFDTGTLDGEDDEATPQSAPATQQYTQPRRQEPQGNSDSPNQGSVPDGSDPIGPWDDPYTGPNQIGFMEDLQQGLNNFLKDSKFDKATQNIAKKAERVTDRISDFMRKEAERREGLGIKDPGYTKPGDPLDLTNPGDNGPSLLDPSLPSEEPSWSTSREGLPGVNDPNTETITGFPTNQIPGSSPILDDSFSKYYESTPTARGTPKTPAQRVQEAHEEFAKSPTQRIDEAFGAFPNENPNQAFSDLLGPDANEVLSNSGSNQPNVDTVEATKAEPPQGLGGLYGDSVPSQLGGKETFGQTFERSVGGFNPNESSSANVIESVMPNAPNKMQERHTRNLGRSELDAIADLANDLGLSVAEVAGVIGTETNDLFSPDVDNGFGYKGAIQFGPEEQKTYGVDRYGKAIDEMTFAEQLAGPVKDYLEDRGFVKGMNAQDLYTTIHAGSPHVDPTAVTDFATKKTSDSTFKDFVEPRIKSIKDYLGSSTYGPYEGYNPYSRTTSERDPSPFTGGNIFGDVGGESRDYGFNPLGIGDNTNFGFSEPRYAGSSRRTTTTTSESGSFPSNSIPGSTPIRDTSGFNNATGNYGGYSQSQSYGGESSGNSGNSTSPGGGGYDSSNTGGPGDYGNTSHGGYSQNDYDNNSSISDWNDNNSWF